MPDAESRFIERMGAALSAAGLARMPSRVFAALLVDDDGRMTAAELADTLSVSPAGVSGAVRYLEQIGMLHREREPGGRRDVFVVDEDAWQGAMMRRDVTYGPIKAALAEAMGRIGEHSPAHRRLALSHEFLVFIDAELTRIEQRWAQHREELEQDL